MAICHCVVTMVRIGDLGLNETENASFHLSLTQTNALNAAEIAMANGANPVAHSAARHHQTACWEALAGIPMAHARTRKAHPAKAAGIVTLNSQKRHSVEGAKLANAVRLTGLAYQKNAQYKPAETVTMKNNIFHGNATSIGRADVGGCVFVV